MKRKIINTNFEFVDILKNGNSAQGSKRQKIDDVAFTPIAFTTIIQQNTHCRILSPKPIKHPLICLGSVNNLASEQPLGGCSPTFSEEMDLMIEDLSSSLKKPIPHIKFRDQENLLNTNNISKTSSR